MFTSYVQFGEASARMRQFVAAVLVSLTALAAPMACPVLGDKSIIHRLKSLPMDDGSRGRRWAARGAVAAALLAVPMTASISYAEPVAAPEAPAVPFAPTAPVAALQAES